MAERSLIGALLTLVLAACGGEAPPEPPVDAGDAGFVDAGQVDAGVPDSGDAGVGDASPDAEVSDAGPLDSGVPDAGDLPDGGEIDAGEVPDAGPPALPTPESVLFIGNSFTLGGPVPSLVESMARYAGFDGFGPLSVAMRAVGGQTLEGHRADGAPEGAPARVMEGWDVVVLQELSTRPTDQIGPAEQFKVDATWFYDLAKSVNPDCNIVLYETWARRFDHSLYPGTFADPTQMQDELRFHYDDAADVYIPSHATAARKTDVRVARVGDAWASQLSGGEPPRLHASDSYHASAEGQYLNALVLYSTLFSRRADGLVPLNGLDEVTAQGLQDTADGVTQASGWGASAVTPVMVPDGDPVQLDLGPTAAAGWPGIQATQGTLTAVPTAAGASTGVYVTAWGFSGLQDGGLSENSLGVPGEVARDTLWVGTFDGHAVALDMEARLVVRGLPPGRYDVTIYASRAGDDTGNGRLTRYRLGAETRDLEVSDNTGTTSVFEGVAPDARGELVIRVGVSPAGTARFGYVGALWVTRVGS